MWFTSAIYITKIALSTGCRWSEAENLTDRNITDNLLTFTKTKNGQNRSVPISDELKAEIPIKKGRLFKSCMSIFRKAIEELNINLPKGQSTHALRHTFASHFMMKGGNILVLQQILGHASITETMKYSHFSKHIYRM